MWGCRPRVANRTRASVRRRSNASGRTGQRTASSRFQNGSRSAGSWSRSRRRPDHAGPGPAWRGPALRGGAAGAALRRPRVADAACSSSVVGTSRPRYRARSKTTAAWTGGPSDHLRDPGYDRARSSPRPERCIPVADDASDHPAVRLTSRTRSARPAARWPRLRRSAAAPAAQAAAAARPARSVRWARELWAPVLILAVVVLVHLPTLGAPLLDRHDFRQTQTAFTARIYHEDGIDLLHPKLPVLGPPWEVPFEFPLFQAAAALVIDAGVAEDLALRATGLASFVLTGFLLWLLVRRQAGQLGRQSLSSSSPHRRWRSNGAGQPSSNTWLWPLRSASPSPGCAGANAKGSGGSLLRSSSGAWRPW